MTIHEVDNEKLALGWWTPAQVTAEIEVTQAQVLAELEDGDHSDVLPVLRERLSILEGLS